MRKVAIFDLDFTLVNADSTTAFTLYFLKRERRLGRLLLLSLFNFLYLTGFMPPNLKMRHRQLCLSFLKGEKRDDLERCSREFVTEKLPAWVNSDILHRYKDLKNQFYTVLVSGSLELVVKCAAERFHFDDYYGSTMKFSREGIFSGELEEDLLYGKSMAVDRLFRKLGGLDLNGSYYFSDNLEDVALMKYFGNPVGVVSRQTEERFWAIRKIKTLFIRPALVWNKALFFIPGSYYLYICRKNMQIVLLYHVGFLLLALFVLLGRPVYASDLVYLFLAFWGYISLYEIGYLWNDCFSTRTEKSPTLRVDESLCGAMPFLAAARITVFSAIALFFAYALPRQPLLFYLLGIAGIALIFSIHNYISPHLRFVTYPPLAASHLVVPLLVFPLNFVLVFLAILLFYLPATVVHGIVKRGENFTDFTRSFRIKAFIIPKCVGLLAVSALSYFSFVPSEFLVMAAWLSIVDIARGVYYVMR